MFCTANVAGLESEVEALKTSASGNTETIATLEGEKAKLEERLRLIDEKEKQKRKDYKDLMNKLQNIRSNMDKARESAGVPETQAAQPPPQGGEPIHPSVADRVKEIEEQERKFDADAFAGRRNTGRQSRSQSRVKQRPTTKEQQLSALNKNIEQLKRQLTGREIPGVDRKSIRNQLSIVTAQRDELEEELQREKQQPGQGKKQIRRKNLRSGTMKRKKRQHKKTEKKYSRK